MRWILDNAFALSASFHDGARLVSYPWGSWHNDTGYKYTDKEAYMTPGKVNIRGIRDNISTRSKSRTDHDEFYRIATAYSFTHPTMKDKPKVRQSSKIAFETYFLLFRSAQLQKRRYQRGQLVPDHWRHERLQLPVHRHHGGRGRGVGLQVPPPL